MSQAWVAAVRRGAVPLALGVACWVLSLWAIEDLHPLLVWLGIILVVLGLVIVVASGRTLGARERRLGAGAGLPGRPGKQSPEG